MLYLMRHGETRQNRSYQLLGRADVAMNDTGYAQAEAAGQWFAKQGIVFSHVFSSPLSRAKETAQRCAPGMPVITDERLTEMDCGPWEGADYRNPAPELAEYFRDLVHNPAPAGMEPLRDVVQRTGDFLEEIKQLSGNVLIVTHAIAMKGCLEYLTPEAGGRYWSTNIGNCAVYSAELKNGMIGVPYEVIMK